MNPIHQTAIGIVIRIVASLAICLTPAALAFALSTTLNIGGPFVRWLAFVLGLCGIAAGVLAGVLWSIFYLRARRSAVD
ncbi:MAG: hypothetical protein V4555_21740 [Acidobacteriota bacterium]